MSILMAGCENKEINESKLQKIENDIYIIE